MQYGDTIRSPEAISAGCSSRAGVHRKNASVVVPCLTYHVEVLRHAHIPRKRPVENCLVRVPWLASQLNASMRIERAVEVLPARLEGIQAFGVVYKPPTQNASRRQATWLGASVERRTHVDPVSFPDITFPGIMCPAVERL
eukprot:6993456-Prymnesium_polylepis.2